MKNFIDENIAEIERLKLEFEKTMENLIWTGEELADSLDVQLRRMSKENLIYMGEYFGLTFKAGAKKKDIVEKLCSGMPRAMAQYIINLEPMQYEFLMKVANAKNGYVLWEPFKPEFNLRQIEYFVSHQYILGIQVDGKPVFTMFPEIRSIFHSKKSNNFDDCLRSNFYRRRIIEGMLHYYGVIDVLDLLRVFNEATKTELTITEFWTDLRELSAYHNSIEIDDFLISSYEVHEENVEFIIEEQMSRNYVDYKIFELEEYIDVVIDGIEPSNSYEDSLIKVLADLIEDNNYAKDIFFAIHLMFRSGREATEALDFVLKLAQKNIKRNDIDSLENILDNVYKYTPQWYLKGYSPDEMPQRPVPNRRKAKKDNLVSFHTGKRITKTDICPCGSGKKFNECCGV